MLMRNNPLANEFSRLSREMEDLFRNLGVSGPVWNGELSAYPALNITDQGESLRVEAEVPGIKMEDIEIYTVGNELTIKGRRVVEKEPEAGYLRRERSVGEFTRVVTLPTEVDADKVQAVLKDGVLTITLPRAESAKPRRIALKSE